MLVFAARHVVPVATPPVEWGAVAVEHGRIVAVGRKHDVWQAVGGAPPTRDLGDAVLLPGLVNAHTHLELSWLAGGSLRAGGFADWIRAVVTARTGAVPEQAAAAAESAVRFVVERGTVAVGDLSNQDWIAPIVARSPLCGVLFHELLGFRAADAQRIVEEGEGRLRPAGPRLRSTLTPHAIYSSSPALLQALARRAGRSQAPLSIHVAESDAETELIRNGAGPLADLLRERGVWDERWRPPGVSPVEALDRLGVLSPRTLAVHCVHVDARDIECLRARGVTVVTCPRSNASLGVGRAPVPDFVAAGIPVALGTDSTASAPDLDLFAEMAALRADHPGLSPRDVLRMATLDGARALGVDRELGSLEVGKRAALLAVRLPGPGDDPLEVVTRGPAEVSLV